MEITNILETLIFEIKENDIVFCRIEDLNILFNLLSKINLNNIKIISHQSDLEVNKLNFILKKPNCVSEWFSINVNFKAKNLIQSQLDEPMNILKT